MDKVLGPADEKAFMEKVDTVFHEAMSQVRKGGPQTAKGIVDALCAALQAVVPAPSMKGLGADQGQGMADEDLADLGADDATEADGQGA